MEVVLSESPRKLLLSVDAFENGSEVIQSSGQIGEEAILRYLLVGQVGD
jgi:hypothetical protein